MTTIPLSTAARRESSFEGLDLLCVEDLLSGEEQRQLRDLSQFFQTVIRPGSIDYWNRAEFPSHLLPLMAEQGMGGIGVTHGSPLLSGLIHMELTRADTSIGTFFGVHNELFTGAVHAFGSPEQRHDLLPELVSFKKIGCFALTEPDSGSDISRQLAASARRQADCWVLDGDKRWIGNGTIADYAVLMARDVEDGEVKGFLVETDRPGFTATVIENKIALRSVQNADLQLRQVRVPTSNKLPGIARFNDVNTLLMNSRTWVGWQTVGQQIAALDVARTYALTRNQFGRPIASRQLVQEHLARMAGNATQSLALMIQLARLQTSGRLTVDHAALAKSSCSIRMRETVALARSILGGNGISTDYEVAKIFADAEAIYTYEGSYEINALIVGRALTGISAFE